MKSPASISVGVALLATSADAFVQVAPARCTAVGAATQRGAKPAIDRVEPQASGRLTLRHQQQPRQRQRSAVPSYTALFSEGGEGGDSPVAATTAADADPVAGEAAVVEEAEEKEVEKPMTEEEMARKAKLEEIERLRAKEKFVTVNTGDHECLQCSFVYKPNEGGQGALPGTAFDDLPSTWVCPVCKAPKDSFIAQTKTIAGFEDNASYGFGGNQMTAGQKNLLIFGSLAAFFVLFLAGYALE